MGATRWREEGLVRAHDAMGELGMGKDKVKMGATCSREEAQEGLEGGHEVLLTSGEHVSLDRRWAYRLTLLP